MKVKAIIAFNAYGYIVSTGEEFEIKDSGIRADLERLGWIEPLEHEVTVNEVKRTRKASK